MADLVRIFPGDGGMARRMREFDWKRTPLGEPDRWPQNLRTSVRLVLTSRRPLFAWWGQNLINLYNDGCAQVLDSEHPDALGHPAPEAWPEIWDQVRPRLEFARDLSRVVASPVVPDIRRLPTLTESELNAYMAASVHGFVATAVVNRAEYVAGLVVLDSTPREWTEPEIALVRETAARTLARVERAPRSSVRLADDRQLRKLNERLERRVREQTAEIERLTARLVATQEEERRRFARDVHDQLGQGMTALRLQIEAMRLKAGAAKLLLEQLDRTLRLADEIDRSIDSLMGDLRPALLEHVGLSSSLRQLVASWSQRFGISASFELAGHDEPRLPRETEVNLYRIVQEALHNIVKHAHATHVTVMLERHPEQTALVILDDGRGFDAGTIGARGTGAGLTGMRERAAVAGGEIEISSDPSRGTSIIVRIPMRDPATD